MLHPVKYRMYFTLSFSNLIILYTYYACIHKYILEWDNKNETGDYFFLWQSPG